MFRKLRTGAWLALISACGGTEPSGTLTLTVDTLPGLVAQATVTISGNVQRSPSASTTVIVVIAGGAATVTDTIQSGTAFSTTVTLNANQENQLAVTASDATGSISNPVVAVIFHDDTGPSPASQTPANQSLDVPLDTPIELQFSERLFATGPGASLIVAQNGEILDGTTTVSADSMRLSFMPNAPLNPNSIVEMVVAGFTDSANNPAANNDQLCFITTDNAFPSDSGSDQFDGGWAAGDANTFVTDPVDIISIKFTREANRLYGLMRFSDDRVFNDAATNNASVILDFDLDQDPNTGFRGIYDFLFEGLAPTSGLGTEMIVGLEPRADLAGLAYVAELVSDETDFLVRELIFPGVCGSYFAFHTDSVLGLTLDDGNFDVAAVALVTDPNGLWADPIPEPGFITIETADIIITAAEPSLRRSPLDDPNAVRHRWIRDHPNLIRRRR